MGGKGVGGIDRDEPFEVEVAKLLHDLRQPLAVLTGSLESLDRQEALPSALPRCRRALARVRGLVDELQALATPHEPRLQRVDLVRLLGQIAEELGAEAERRQVTLQLDAWARPIPRGMPRALWRAFINVIGNAVEASPPGGAVHILVGVEGDRGFVEVLDGGPGVPAELRERVFETFFTLREGGSGLGLAVARSVATAHAGSVRFLDGPGGRLRFELPLDQSN